MVAIGAIAALCVCGVILIQRPPSDLSKGNLKNIDAVGRVFAIFSVMLMAVTASFVAFAENRRRRYWYKREKRAAEDREEDENFVARPGRVEEEYFVPRSGSGGRKMTGQQVNWQPPPPPPQQQQQQMPVASFQNIREDR